MELSQQDVARIVEVVVQRLGTLPLSSTNGRHQLPAGIYGSVDEAVRVAQEAQRKISTLESRGRIIAALRVAGVAHARELAEIAVQETGMGNIEDKVRKNASQAEMTPGTEMLMPEALSGDHGLTLIENAPWGVIASVTPSTNPAATIINNSISMIAAGNAVVFAPHPGAKCVSQRAVAVLNEALIAAGGPPGLIATVAEPSIEVAQELFRHPGIALLVVTGGQGVVREARKLSDKRLIAAGAGNPPVVVDETADIERAARCIVAGASFDNNIVCADEKEIIAVDSIADSLKQAMSRCGAYELTPSQGEELARIVLKHYPGPRPHLNKEWIGKDAVLFAREIGITVPDATRLLFVETDKGHPYAQLEMMMPIIPLIRVPDADRAIDVAIELEHGYHHTAAMHSRNLDHLHRMATEINTSVFVKNGSCLAGLGFGGEGWTTMTISTPTGEGVTCARTFVRLRRCVLVDHFRIV